MTETNQNEPIDFQLAKAIRELDREMQPGRDLWQGIERNIVIHPQRTRRGWQSDWLPYGVAASLLVAISTLVLTLARTDQFSAAPLSFDQSMGQMQQEYLRIRNPMVEEFGRVNKDLDPETLQELYRSLEVLEMARRQIEEQVRQDPENTRLVEMLMRIHEQELELLKQDFTGLSRSI